jgi:protein-S-isoprenylcysteine O-methyltransferase Ste14
MAQALKSTLGLLSLVMMCLAIFLPAGTVYYPEAWCYLVIFFTGVISISIYIFRNDKALLQSRLKGGATAEKRSLQKLVQAVASLGFVGLYIIAAFDHRFHWSHVPQWVVIAPDLVLLFTMLLFFIVFKKNSYLSAVIEVQGQKIIDNGPYGVVRHPMYSAALLLFGFSPLSLASYSALLTLPLMFMVLVLRCLDEEKLLKNELPAYNDYCSRVRWRLIPLMF